MKIRYLSAMTGAVALLIAMATPANAAGQRPLHMHSHGESHDWALHKENTLDKTVAMPGGGTVEIDNFEGDVIVRGGAGNQAAITVHQVWSGDSAAKLEQAQRDVRLDISQDGSHLRLYVAGPFRSHDGGIDWNGWERTGYQVRFDVQVEMPAGAELIAKTVNGGRVEAADLTGRFEAANVNGPVTLERMGGAGNAHSVNGAVHVTFARNPTGDCSFRTVNGRIEVGFRSDLAADLSFQTLNGDVYSDFEYTQRVLPATVESEEHQGRHRYRSRGRRTIRIGSGGPQFSFRTINGDILIHRQDR